MLNIGKLGSGGEGYYLSTVASGVEDYYTGAGEAPGYWAGSASSELGLSGRVHAEALRAVLGAVDPASGQRLTAASGRSMPGFDLTFRAPKSVSLLYGLGGLDTALAVREAHDVAVAAALGYLEEHAGWSRRGAQGRERVQVSGFVAAAFRHRTSRAGDPLLHTHVLVSNLGRAVHDGRWRTLDARHLYLHAKTAGYLYQAQLRHELTRRLGVEWGPLRNGCGDLAGVPDDLIRAFSQRRAEIEQRMAERGESTARAAQAATLATRRAKDYGVTAGALQAEWQARAQAHGFPAERVEALVDRAQVPALPDAEAAALAADLAGPDGLTERASTFTRRDVVRGWCERLPAGADPTRVGALTDAFLASECGNAVRLLEPAAVSGDEVIRLRDGRAIHGGDEPRYSTPELLALEQRILDRASDPSSALIAVAGEAPLAEALARRPSLSAEQGAMVRQLSTSGAGIDVVVGKAGAGKTFALDAARDAWQRSGTCVVGCALAARAAAELQDGAGIPSTTLDALLADLDRSKRGYGLAPGSVVVVDEAGMVGTRKLARLLDHAEDAGAKVVLVGDHRQLPAIDAGGLFRGLTARLPAIELTENRRQHEQWEREALDQLRDGDPSAALDAYVERDRIVLGDTADAVRERLVDDWAAADGGMMVALRVADVDDLNRRARRRLAAAGALWGPMVSAGERDFQCGDRVLLLRNDPRLRVFNGDRATVTALDPDARSVTVHLDRDGRQVTLPARYLDDGNLGHAYAVTAHKAQGSTVEQAFVLGSDAAYREWGYVALSRGRHTNRLYLVATNDPDPAHGSAQTPASPVKAFEAAMTRSREQDLASDYHDWHASELLEARAAAAERRLRTHQQALQRAQSELQQATERRDRHAYDLNNANRGLGRLLRRDHLTHLRCALARAETAIRSWQDRTSFLDVDTEVLMRRATAARAEASSAQRRTEDPMLQPPSQRSSSLQRTGPALDRTPNGWDAGIA